MEEIHDFESEKESSNARKRKGVLLAVIVLALAAFLIPLGVNTLGGVTVQSESEEVIAANVQTLEELEQQEVPDIASLNAGKEQAEEQEAVGAEEAVTGEAGTKEAASEESAAEPMAVAAIDESTEEQKIMSMEDPDMATLLEWFNGSAIVGDSFVAGLSSAQFLNSSIVFGEVGISVYGSDDLIAQMEAVYPQTVFLSFGLNDMSHYGEDVEKFIESYRPRVEKICTDLPSAKVYLVAVLPVRQDVITNGYTKMAYSDLYNQRLQEFASEMGVGYIDPWFILKQDPSYYGSDGMHVNSSFYYKWLTYLADMAGLSS